MNATPNATLGSGFDDMEDDDLDGPAPASTPAAQGPVVYRENCRKCRGSGKYAFFSSLGHSNCTACKGRGFQEYRHSAEHRAKQRAQNAAAKERKAAADAQAKALLADEWRTANPGEASWLADNAQRNDFAASLSASLLKWGSLTEGQLRAVRNSMAREADRAAQAAERVATAKTVDVGAIEAAFSTAVTNGLLRPQLRLEGFVFKRASATGRNAGALYVTRAKANPYGEHDYLGKVADGKFIKSRDCTDLDEAAIVSACADPREAALRYGRLMGACSVCGRTLVDPVSIEAGIGPICAGKYGF